MQSLAAERYFVSKEQEDAANWQNFENYKRLNGRLGTLLGTVQHWGIEMHQFGELLKSNPYALTALNQAQANQLKELPDKSDLEKAVVEMNDLRQQVSTLANSLKKAGLDVSKLE